MPTPPGAKAANQHHLSVSSAVSCFVTNSLSPLASQALWARLRHGREAKQHAAAKLRSGIKTVLHCGCAVIQRRPFFFLLLTGLSSSFDLPTRFLFGALYFVSFFFSATCIPFLYPKLTATHNFIRRNPQNSRYLFFLFIFLVFTLLHIKQNANHGLAMAVEGNIRILSPWL